MIKAKLNNGVEIPYVGLGVYRMDDNQASEDAIMYALSQGYRHLDTASYYHNEDAVGRAIKKSGIPREEIFVTTKVWNEDQRQNKVREAFEESLRKLDTNYIDLYLIHWPVVDKIQETWKVLEGLYKDGLVKAIGVSNFKDHHLETLKEISTISPAINQVELHPFFNQQSILDYCKKEGIQLEAWSPLGASKTDLLKEPLLVKLSEKYDKSPAQIVLRWNFQRDVVIIPKSSNKERLVQNMNIFDFNLTEDDMNQINSLDKGLRLGSDPDTFTF